MKCVIKGCKKPAECSCVCSMDMHLCREHSFFHCLGEGQHKLQGLPIAQVPEIVKKYANRLLKKATYYKDLQHYFIENLSVIQSSIYGMFAKKLQEIQITRNKLYDKIASIQSQATYTQSELDRIQQKTDYFYSLPISALNIDKLTLPISSFLSKISVLNSTPNSILENPETTSINIPQLKNLESPLSNIQKIEKPISIPINTQELEKLRSSQSLSEKLSIIKEELKFPGYLLPPEGIEINCVVFGFSRHHVYYGSYDCNIYVSNYRTNSHEFTLRGHTDRVRCLALTSNEAILASGSSDTRCVLWDVVNRVRIREFSFHGDTIWDLAFTPTYQTLLTVSADKSMSVIDLRRYCMSAKLTGHNAEINAVVVSHDSKVAYTGSDDTTIRAWNLINNTEAFTLKGHTGKVLSLALEKNSVFLYSASSDSSILEWNVLVKTNTRSLCTFKAWVRSVRMGSDNNNLVIGNYDGIVATFNLATNACNILYKHYEGVKSVAISPNSGYVASTSFDNSVKVWNLKTAQEVARFGDQKSVVSCITISEDLEYLAVAYYNATISVVHVPTNIVKGEYNQHSLLVSKVLIDSHNEYVVSSDMYNVRVWSITSFKDMLYIDSLEKLQANIEQFPLLSNFRRILS